jgi:hypothetical protein
VARLNNINNVISTSSRLSSTASRRRQVSSGRRHGNNGTVRRSYRQLMGACALRRRRHVMTQSLSHRRS